LQKFNAIDFKEIIIGQCGINKLLIKYSKQSLWLCHYGGQQRLYVRSFPCICLGRALDTSAIL